MDHKKKMPAARRALPNTLNGADFTADPNSRNCSTAAQLARVIAALRLRPQSTDDLRRMGIYQVSARIKGLRDLGYDIRTDLVNSVDAFGYVHPRTAVYSLVSAPGRVV